MHQTLDESSTYYSMNKILVGTLITKNVLFRSVLWRTLTSRNMTSAFVIQWHGSGELYGRFVRFTPSDRLILREHQPCPPCAWNAIVKVSLKRFVLVLQRSTTYQSSSAIFVFAPVLCSWYDDLHVLVAKVYECALFFTYHEQKYLFWLFQANRLHSELHYLRYYSPLLTENDDVYFSNSLFFHYY